MEQTEKPTPPALDSRISPHFSHEKLENPSLEDLIDVLEDRVKFWLLAPAKALFNVPFAFVAAVSLLMTYFEAHAIYLNGQDSYKKSKRFFRDGFLDVFRRSGYSKALLERVANLIYEDARCGLFHAGIVGGRIYFAEAAGELVITFPPVDGKIDENGSIQSVMMDPAKFYIVVERHFTEYVRLLRDANNAELRESFKKAVDLKWCIGEPDRVIGMSEAEFLNRLT